MYQRYKWTAVAEDRIAILKEYEPIQPYVLLELARMVGSDTFIDVGANIGVYSIFMSSLECVKSVHSFEPSAQTFEELSSNTKLNATSKIKIYKKALSDVSQTVKFGIVGAYSGANGIVEGSIHAKDKFVREETIDCVSLDTVGIMTSGNLSVKIDVEGHERKVLVGAELLLTRNQSIIQMERYEEDTGISDILSKYGYRKLFNVGPDFYYANINGLTPNDIVAVFERASKTLIASNLETRVNEHRPLRVRVLPGFDVEVSGAISSFARKARQRIQAR